MGEGRVTLPLTWGHIPVHYFYATNTPLITIITTGILATPRGIEPRFMTSKAIVLPLDDRVLLVPVARFELARHY